MIAAREMKEAKNLIRYIDHPASKIAKQQIRFAEEARKCMHAKKKKLKRAYKTICNLIEPAQTSYMELLDGHMQIAVREAREKQKHKKAMKIELLRRKILSILEPPASLSLEEIYRSIALEPESEEIAEPMQEIMITILKIREAQLAEKQTIVDASMIEEKIDETPTTIALKHIDDVRKAHHFNKQKPSGLTPRERIFFAKLLQQYFENPSCFVAIDDLVTKLDIKGGRSTINRFLLDAKSYRLRFTGWQLVGSMKQGIRLERSTEDVVDMTQ